MQQFTLATLWIDERPQTALGVRRRLTRLSELDAGLNSPLVELLRDWPVAFPRLAEAAERAFPSPARF